MSLKDYVANAPVKLGKVELLDQWIAALDDDEAAAALTLLRNYPADFTARALTAEGFSIGEKSVYAWRRAHAE